MWRFAITRKTTRRTLEAVCMPATDLQNQDRDRGVHGAGLQVGRGKNRGLKSHPGRTFSRGSARKSGKLPVCRPPGHFCPGRDGGPVRDTVPRETVFRSPETCPETTLPALLLPCTIITLIRHGTVSSAMLPAPPRSLRGLCLRYRGGSILSQRFWLTLSPAVAKGRFSDKWSQSPINWGESTQMRDPAKAGLLPFAVGLKAGGATPWGASLL